MHAFASALFPVPLTKSGALSFHKPALEIKPIGPKKSPNGGFFVSARARMSIAFGSCTV